MYYVYSKTSNDVVFSFFDESVNTVNPPSKQILILGGSNIVPTDSFVTPYGVKTTITDEQYELLISDYEFNRRVNDGFYKVIKEELPIAKVVNDLEEADKSAPITPEEVQKTAKKRGIEVEAHTGKV